MYSISNDKGYTDATKFWKQRGICINRVGSDTKKKKRRSAPECEYLHSGAVSYQEWKAIFDGEMSLEAFLILYKGIFLPEESCGVQVYFGLFQLKFLIQAF